MNNSRRSFIKNGSLIIAGATLISFNETRASAKKEEKLAIQLYSVDKEMHENAKATLAALQKTGYEYVEHADYSNRKFYGYSPADFGKLITDSGLTLLSGHTVLHGKHFNKAAKCFTKQWHHTIEDAATAGQRFLITPWLDASLWTDETGFKHFMDIFNLSGELCKKSGLQFGYHNHDFEFTHTFQSNTLYDLMLHHTDTQLVAQQLDIGNIYQTNIIIADLFAKYPGRFQLMHIKDIAPTDQRHNQYKTVSIGQGKIDVKDIVDSARKLGGTSCFIIEQEHTIESSPFDDAKLNFSAFQSLDINPSQEVMPRII